MRRYHERKSRRDPAAGGVDSADKNAMWCTRYRPERAKEVCGNAVPVESMHTWLSEWKSRIALEGTEVRIPRHPSLVPYYGLRVRAGLQAMRIR